MKSVRLIAVILFYMSRLLAFLVLGVAVYLATVVLLYEASPSSSLPIQVSGKGFQLFYPFTQSVFLLGDYSAAYLVNTLTTIVLYGLFLLLLSGVFHAFRQEKLFTPKAVRQLSSFYMINLLIPVIFIASLLVFGRELSDALRITLLHLVIGIFSFFMAAIFKQGLVLQQEQDLTF
jgi:hypothetical protein